MKSDISRCQACQSHIPFKVRPVVQADSSSQILIIGQAPGRKVHETGVPWNDASGQNLRSWLGVDKAQFYDERLFAIMPMGFCYPGKGQSGDLPPRPECAPLWHSTLLKLMPEIKLTLLIGHHAQKYYLRDGYRTLTENVKQHKAFLPGFLPLPHPSPRNRFWQSKNPWFVDEVLPVLKARVRLVISDR